jgi:hypothetical protein
MTPISTAAFSTDWIPTIAVMSWMKALVLSMVSSVHVQPVTYTDDDEDQVYTERFA